MTLAICLGIYFPSVAIANPFVLQTEPEYLISDPKDVATANAIWELEQEAAKKKAVLNLPKSDVCRCIVWASKYLGVPSQHRGAAKNYVTNSKTPKAGSIVITYESAAGHAAVIEKVLSVRTYEVVEANYSRCRVTRRVIDTTQVRIKGYIDPNLPIE